MALFAALLGVACSALIGVDEDPVVDPSVIVPGERPADADGGEDAPETE